MNDNKEKVVTLDGQPLADVKKLPEVPDSILRRMNHEDWLEQFSQVLGLQSPGSPPLTPMRQGAIHRLQLAAMYIRLLKKDLWQAQHSKPEPEEVPEGR